MAANWRPARYWPSDNRDVFQERAPSKSWIAKIGLAQLKADFLDRETTSMDASFIIPLVTVNNQTDIVEIHICLLLALQLSVVHYCGQRLDIEPTGQGCFR